MSVNSRKCIAFEDLGLHCRIVRKKHLISINVRKIFDKATRKMLLRLRKENSKKNCIFLGETLSRRTLKRTVQQKVPPHRLASMGCGQKCANQPLLKGTSESNCPWHCGNLRKNLSIFPLWKADRSPALLHQDVLARLFATCSDGNYVFQ
jgi:hypothetical protein